MVNWRDISPEFTEELAQEWKDKGFSLKEVYSPGSDRRSLEELVLAQKGQQNQKQVVQILYNPPKGGNH